MNVGNNNFRGQKMTWKSKFGKIIYMAIQHQKYYFNSCLDDFVLWALFILDRIHSAHCTLFNPFVHNSLHGGYFMIRLWISITAIQIEIFKFSKDPVLCICINFKKCFLHSWLSCQIKTLWFKMCEGVATFKKMVII